jgi:hypothetical protein
MKKKNYELFTGLVFVLWIVIWESFDGYPDPILHYGGIFIGVLLIGIIMHRLKSIFEINSE